MKNKMKFLKNLLILKIIKRKTQFKNIHPNIFQNNKKKIKQNKKIK